VPINRTQWLGIVGAYLSTRKALWLLAIVAVLGVVAAGWGSAEASTPTAEDSRGEIVPLWRLLGLGAALVPVLTLASPMQALEEAAGRSYHRLRTAVLAAAFLVSSGCILTGAAIGASTHAIPLIARALPAWFGLALISGRVLAWHHAWVGPGAVMCVLLYWGPNNSSEGYDWWEFTARDAGHMPSLLLSVGLFACGLAAYSLTPWRLRSILRPRRPAVHVNRSVPDPVRVTSDCDFGSSPRARSSR